MGPPLTTLTPIAAALGPGEPSGVAQINEQKGVFIHRICPVSAIQDDVKGPFHGISGRTDTIAKNARGPPIYPPSCCQPFRPPAFPANITSTRGTGSIRPMNLVPHRIPDPDPMTALKLRTAKQWPAEGPPINLPHRIANHQRRQLHAETEERAPIRRSRESDSPGVPRFYGSASEGFLSISTLCGF